MNRNNQRSLWQQSRNFRRLGGVIALLFLLYLLGKSAPVATPLQTPPQTPPPLSQCSRDRRCSDNRRTPDSKGADGRRNVPRPPEKIRGFHGSI